LTTVWVKANSASRVPLTGRMWRVGIEPAGRHAEAPFAPLADGLAQGRQAEGARVHRQLVEVVGHGLGDEAGDACFGSPIDRAMARLSAAGCDAAQQGAQFLERVGLKLGQGMVHRRKVS
jgi:hypothetical protein